MASQVIVVSEVYAQTRWAVRWQCAENISAEGIGRSRYLRDRSRCAEEVCVLLYECCPHAGHREEILNGDALPVAAPYQPDSSTDCGVCLGVYAVDRGACDCMHA